MARNLITAEVKGLREALDNLKRLPDIIANKIVRKASRQGGNVLLKAVRGGIYSGLQKRTGLMGFGLGLNVGMARSKNRVTAYIKEREIKTAGEGRSSRAARAGAFAKRSRQSQRVAPRFGAFYWRFLELGVAERRTASGANRGALRPTGNVGAAFTSAAGSAIDTFRRILQADIETEVSKMPKGGK